MKESLDIINKVWEFLYSVYPALFGQVIFYFYRDYKFKRAFSLRLFTLHLLITIWMAVLVIKGISIFEFFSWKSLFQDLKYFLIFLGWGFSFKIIEILDARVPEKLESEADKFFKKKSDYSLVPKFQKDENSWQASKTESE